MEDTVALHKQTVPDEDPGEQQRQEDRRQQNLKCLFGSSKVLLTFGERSLKRPELQAAAIIEDKANEHCRRGKAAMEESEYEWAVTCFTKAIHLQPDKPEIYVLRGEAFLHLCDFQSAALSYRRACALQPNSHSDRLAFIYFLQGQCLFDRGLFLDALASFTKAAELKPGFRACDMRSVACLSALGQFDDCLKLVTDWIAWNGPSAELYVLRARLHKQLNKTPQCFQDVKCALKLNPSCPEGRALMRQLKETAERARQVAAERVLRKELPQALKAINIALEYLPLDQHLYMFRGILYRRLKDFTAAIEDLLLVMELSESTEDDAVEGINQGQSLVKDAQFQLVLTYNDFSLECYSKGLYNEATALLSKALEEEKKQPALYVNRGDCFFKQKTWLYALADYQQAEEILGPNNPTIRQRLSVLHTTLGHICFKESRFKDAVTSFSEALQYEPTLCMLYEMRSKAHRKLGCVDQAREDFIRALLLQLRNSGAADMTVLLQPRNSELPAMLMGLFPGYSVSEVLSTAMVQSVRLQLEETLQTHSSCLLHEKQWTPPHALSNDGLQLCDTDQTFLQ